MRTKFFILLFLAFFIITNAQEIPNLTYTQTFDYPEGAQDGSPGSILSPENMYWNSYSNAYLITYVPVLSTNPIYIETGEAIVFSFYIPPYTEAVNFGFNGQVVATQFCRVANLGETLNKEIPATYNSGDISDDDWMWLGVGGRTHQYTRNTNFYTTGSYVYFAFYNGANVDNDYDGVPEGDLQATYDLSTFNVSWLITEEDSASYVAWANGTTNCTETIEAGEISGTQTICDGEDPSPFTSIVDATGNADLTYQWQYSEDQINWIDAIGETNPTWDLGAINYGYTTQANLYGRRMATDCSGTVYSNTIILTVDVCSSIENNNINSEVNIFPNPAHNLIHIENSNAEYIQILDLTGNVVKEVYTQKSIETIQISELNKGIYFVKVGEIVQKVIKN